MASRYLKSTTGSDANGGTSWVDAKASMAGIDAIDTAGDTIYVSQAHSETTAAAVSYTFAGTAASPTKIVCGNDAATPPTTIASSAIVATTGNTSSITPSLIGYCYGLTFDVGQTGTGTASFVNNTGPATYDTCTLKLSSTGTSSRITLANAATGVGDYVGCSFRFSAAGQGFGNSGIAKIRGGSVLAGGTSPTALFAGLTGGNRLLVDGFDLSNCSSTVNIANNNAGCVLFAMRDCKLPASWTGSLNAATPGAGSVWEMINCDSGSTAYRYRKATQFGTIQDETTLVRTGGASDGTTTFSLKCVTNANAQKPHQTLDTYELAKWNTTTGSGVTVTVSFLHDSLTALNSDEIWMDVLYLGTSGNPLGSWTTSKVDALTAGSAVTSDSGSTWTTSGMTNPNKQKLSLTFTPQVAGFIYATVRVGKASYTVYVDPKLQ